MTAEHRLAYIPALDGLRAVAVIGVLLYHGQVSWMRGGFLGVDVFFALSGFLITSLLLAEWNAWGALDLRAFWLRRARRLLPALVIVVLAVSVYFSAGVDRSTAQALRGDSLATLFYVANWRLVASGESYFAQYESPSPLRHMWSLGIEEQWYLLFPLLLVVLLTVLHRRRRLLAPVLAVLGLCSAGVMAAGYVPGSDPSRVYYGTDTRVQELLVGAALAAFLWTRRPAVRGRARRRWQGLVAGLAGVVGLGGVLASFALARETHVALYRGGFLAIAALTATLVGSVALVPDGPVAQLLSHRWLVAIGIVSYGLYLWHWPVYVALTPDRTGWHGNALLALRLGVSAAAAAASYVLVERPIRSGQALTGLTPRARIRLGAAALPLAAAAVFLVSASLSTAPTRTPQALPNPAGSVPPGPPATVFLVGDSVPMGLRQHFRGSDVPGLSVTGTTQLGCGLLPLPRSIDGEATRLDPTCVRWAKTWPTVAGSKKLDVAMVFVGIGEQFDRVVDGRIVRFGTPEYESMLTLELDEITGGFLERGVPVALPTVPCHRVPDTGLSRDAPIINDESRVTALNAMVARYVRSKDRADLTLLDLHDALCRDGYRAVVNGARLRTDGLHFSPEGASLVWRWLGPQLLATARRG